MKKAVRGVNDEDLIVGCGIEEVDSEMVRKLKNEVKGLIRRWVDKIFGGKKVVSWMNLLVNGC